MAIVASPPYNPSRRSLSAEPYSRASPRRAGQPVKREGCTRNMAAVWAQCRTIDIAVRSMVVVGWHTHPPSSRAMATILQDVNEPSKECRLCISQSALRDRTAPPDRYPRTLAAIEENCNRHIHGSDALSSFLADDSLVFRYEWSATRYTSTPPEGSHGAALSVTRRDWHGHHPSGKRRRKMRHRLQSHHLASPPFPVSAGINVSSRETRIGQR